MTGNKQDGDENPQILGADYFSNGAVCGMGSADFRICQPKVTLDKSAYSLCIL